MDPRDYDYTLPEDLVALAPASPRDMCNLLIYDMHADELCVDLFRNIHKYIPSQSLIVLNSTVVSPSRVTLHKDSGAKVICLLLMNEWHSDPSEIRILVDRKVTEGDILYCQTRGTHEAIIRVLSHGGEGVFVCQSLVPHARLVDLVDKVGSMPLPPYLKKTTIGRSALKTKYQTVFAGRREKSEARVSHRLSSIAEPTAGLHVTQRVLSALRKKDVSPLYIDLEVGLGTFAPVTQIMIDEDRLHREWYHVSPQGRMLLSENKKRGDKCIAVGTTVVRALESIPRESGEEESSRTGYYHETELFIRKGYTFRYTEGLVTNFHVPRSSLMMLVDAFLADKRSKRSIIDLYDYAIEKKFKFYSFGDAMLLI